MKSLPSCIFSQKNSSRLLHGYPVDRIVLSASFKTFQIFRAKSNRILPLKGVALFKKCIGNRRITLISEPMGLWYRKQRQGIYKERNPLWSLDEIICEGHYDFELLSGRSYLTSYTGCCDIATLSIFLSLKHFAVQIIKRNANVLDHCIWFESIFYQM